MLDNTKNLKLGAVVCCYNRERFIGPYLEMLKNFGVRCVVTLGEKSWVNHAQEENEKPDRTEFILKTFFPDVKVIKGIYSHHRDSMNIGLKHLEDCDINFVNDCDMFITHEDWEKMLRFIEDNYTHNDVFSVDFEKMIKEYYYDHRYGKAALVGGDYPIFAIKPFVEMRHMTRASSDSEVVWNDSQAKFHHMRFCQKGRNDKRCFEPNGDLHDYTPAPKEIFNLLEKWETILETL